MAKALSRNALDAALEYVALRADLMVLCSGEPQSADEATTPLSAGGRRLASVALTTGIGLDFTLGDGSVSGRRVSVSAKSAVAIEESGTADHVALIDTATGEMLVVTEVTEIEPVTAGDVVSVRSFASELLDPA